MGGILYLGTNHGKLPKTLMAWSRKNLTVKVTALKAICFRLGIPVRAKVFLSKPTVILEIKISSDQPENVLLSQPRVIQETKISSDQPEKVFLSQPRVIQEIKISSDQHVSRHRL